MPESPEKTRQSANTGKTGPQPSADCRLHCRGRSVPFRTISRNSRILLPRPDTRAAGGRPMRCSPSSGARRCPRRRSPIRPMATIPRVNWRRCGSSSTPPTKSRGGAACRRRNSASGLPKPCAMVSPGCLKCAACRRPISGRIIPPSPVARRTRKRKPKRCPPPLRKAVKRKTLASPRHKTAKTKRGASPPGKPRSAAWPMRMAACCRSPRRRRRGTAGAMCCCRNRTARLPNSAQPGGPTSRR